MSTQITRSAGIPTGLGYVVGNGYSGKTKEFDSKVCEIAEQLRAMFNKNIEIRYNSDRESGGAFIKDDNYSCTIGIGAGMMSSEFRSMSWEEKLDFHMKDYDKLPKDILIYHIVLDESIARPGVDVHKDFETVAEAFEYLNDSIEPQVLKEYLEKI